MITAEIKIEIIRNMIFNYRDNNGFRNNPKEQIAFWQKILEIIDMKGEENGNI